MIKHRPESHDLDEAQFRKVVAVQYINASSEILRGMKQLVGANNFLVLVCLSQLHRIHKARNMASFLCEDKEPSRHTETILHGKRHGHYNGGQANQ